MSETVKVQCKSMNRNNKRCGHYTIKGQYCRQHQEKNGVRIKNSKIKDAGLGLITTKVFEKGDVIAPYTGDVTINPKTKKQRFGPYVLKASNAPLLTVIDAKKSNTGAARYAQMCTTKKCSNNAELVYDHTTDKVTLRALDTIPKGSEVYVNYGKLYSKKTPSQSLRVVTRELNREKALAEAKAFKNRILEEARQHERLQLAQLNSTRVQPLPTRVQPPRPTVSGPSPEMVELRKKYNEYKDKLAQFLKLYKEDYEIARKENPSQMEILKAKRDRDVPKYENKINSYKAQIEKLQKKQVIPPR